MRTLDKERSFNPRNEAGQVERKLASLRLNVVSEDGPPCLFHWMLPTIDTWNVVKTSNQSNWSECTSLSLNDFENDLKAEILNMNQLFRLFISNSRNSLVMPRSLCHLQSLSESWLADNLVGNSGIPTLEDTMSYLAFLKGWGHRWWHCHERPGLALNDVCENIAAITIILHPQPFMGNGIPLWDPVAYDSVELNA